ncbi:MAG: Rne/Rng family ribonuclease, partial [Limisphaerales bacterium]
MSDRNFSRRRKGPMRFRPTGGIGSPKAAQARAEATGNDIPDEVFDVNKHHKEIEQAENIAAGLPPDAQLAPAPQKEYKREFREPDLRTPAEVSPDDDDDFEPVPVADSRPEGIVETIRAAANKVVRKVQRLIKPVHRIHKEVIINAESLETRVAVLEDGKLEEFTIERTSDER